MPSAGLELFVLHEECLFKKQQQQQKKTPAIICALYLELMPQLHAQGSRHPRYPTSARLPRLMCSSLHHDVVTCLCRVGSCGHFCGAAGKP